MQILWFFTPTGDDGEPLPGKTDLLLHHRDVEARYGFEMVKINDAMREGGQLCRRWNILLSARGVKGMLYVQTNDPPREITPDMQIYFHVEPPAPPEEIPPAPPLNPDGSSGVPDAAPNPAADPGF